MILRAFILNPRSQVTLPYALVRLCERMCRLGLPRLAPQANCILQWTCFNPSTFEAPILPKRAAYSEGNCSRAFHWRAGNFASVQLMHTMTPLGTTEPAPKELSRIFKYTPHTIPLDDFETLWIHHSLASH
jgi:hypothetical protein